SSGGQCLATGLASLVNRSDPLPTRRLMTASNLPTPYSLLPTPYSLLPTP
ncbi:MAG: hypothetical protein F6K56_37085, partial [Moorea sp. SIO3G5]|nr:hypothetical protein [Moorena sp. SIO3G5]